MSREEFHDLPVITPGKYQHYKGNLYEVIDVGCHTETHEYFVVYKPLYEHEGQPNIWLRPHDMFVGMVEKDGRVFPRFKKVDA